MLGIEDPWILTAYLACLASTAICVVYGLINWNRGQEDVAPQDVKWAHEEIDAQEEQG